MTVKVVISYILTMVSGVCKTLRHKKAIVILAVLVTFSISYVRFQSNTGSNVISYAKQRRIAKTISLDSLDFRHTKNFANSKGGGNVTNVDIGVGRLMKKGGRVAKNDVLRFAAKPGGVTDSTTTAETSPRTTQEPSLDVRKTGKKSIKKSQKKSEKMSRKQWRKTSGNTSQSWENIKAHHILDMEPIKYLPELKSPCWVETRPTNDPKRKNGGGDNIVRCLPYFFIGGFSKCGTSDLFHKLKFHPNVVKNCQKEPTFFDPRRKKKTLGKYVNCYRKLSWLYTAWYNKHRYSPPPKFISMDATPATMWRTLSMTAPTHRDTPHVIHHLLPDTKIVVLMRDPATRLYSDYNFRNTRGHKFVTSPQLFHELVLVFLAQYRQCIVASPLRKCLQNMEKDPTFNGRVNLFNPTIDFYAFHLREWLEVFPREQFLFLKSEEYYADVGATLAQVAIFLDIDASEDAIQPLTVLRTRNTKKYRHGPMLNSTRLLIQQFFAPFNRELAELLGDDKYLWNN